MEHERKEQAWTLGRAILVVRRWPLRFVSTLAMALGCGVLWVGTQEPEYRARVTLLLDPARSPTSADRGEQPTLDLTSEIAVMRSYEVLEATVSTPETGPGSAAGESPGDHDPASHFVRLGLTTTTDDLAARPIPSTLRRLLPTRPAEGSLRAAASADLDIASIEFLGPMRARIATPSRFGRVSDAIEVDVVPGSPISTGDGAELRLWPEGDLTGRTFHVQARTQTDAINALRSRIDIEREGRATRVVHVNVRDTDPDRAATIANALAANYFEVTRLRSLRQASGTARFIEEQLAIQQLALETSSKDLAAIQSEIPNAIVPEETTTALLEQIRQLEKERLRLSVAEQSFHETLSLLDGGDTSALSRLDPKFLDQSSQQYLSHLADLTAESAGQDRSDTRSYRYVLLSRVTELQDEEERVQAELESIRNVVARSEEGDTTQFSRLVTAGEDALPVDPMTSVLLSELGRLQTLRDQKAAAFTDKHPDVIEARAAVVAIEQRIIGHLRSRITSHERAIDRISALTDDRRELLATQPGKERAAIGAALTELREITREHILGRLAGISSERNSIIAEISRVEADLERLPENARRIAGPMRRVEAQKAMVQFLTKNLHEAQVKESAPVHRAEVVDPATRPNSRQKPNVMLALLIAAILGVALGLWHAAWCEDAHGHVLGVDELQATTGFPCLATLTPPGDAAPGDRTLPGNTGRTAHLEDDTAARFLRTSLLSAASGTRRADLGRIVMITSCHAGEGRAHTVTELARACAIAGDQTLIIDVDGSTPFSIPGGDRTGLAQVLAGHVAFDQAIQPCVDLGADFLPSGGAGRSDFAGIAIERVLTQSTREYDVVIVRLPPVESAPEATLLLPLADGALFVVREGVTARSTLLRVAQRLRSMSQGATGAILIGRPSRPRVAHRESDHAVA